MTTPPSWCTHSCVIFSIHCTTQLRIFGFLFTFFFFLSWVGCCCCCHCGPSDVFCFGFLVAAWQCTSFAVVAITHSWPSRGCGPSCQPIGQSSSKTSSADCKPGPNKSTHCSPPTSRALVKIQSSLELHTNFVVFRSELNGGKPNQQPGKSCAKGK